MAIGTPREFAVGHVISNGFRIFFANIVPFGLISLIIFIPYILLIIAAARGDIPAEGSTVDLGTRVLGLLLSYVVTGAIAYGAFNDMRGRRIGTGECLSRGLAVMFPILGVAILTGIAVLLGFIALIIPGLFLLTVLWVAVPVAVVERPGVFEALRRSAALTENYRWQVFGILMVLVAINVGAGVILFFIIGSVLSGTGTHSTNAVIGVYLISAVLEALLTALGAVMTTVGYHDLRAVKEGISIEDITKVFD